MGQQILLDTTVLLAGLNSRDAHHVDAKEIFTINTRSNFAISAITLAEALVRPYSLGPIQGEQAEGKIDSLIGEIISLSSEHVLLAAKIRSKNKTRIPDSMIIATAIVNNLELISFDRKMMGIYERAK